MKKISIFLILSVVLMFSLSSCGGEGPEEDIKRLADPTFTVTVENEMIAIEIDKVENAMMYEIQVRDLHEESEWFDVITTDKTSWAGSFVWGNYGFDTRVRAVYEYSDGTKLYSDYTEIEDIENIYEFDSDDPPIAEALPERDSYYVYEEELASVGDTYVEKCYNANNNAGFMATIKTKSYGGTITTVVVIDKDGTIRGVKVMDHSDTEGVGTKAMTPEYLDQYEGLTALDSSIEFISGATVTSAAINEAVECALEQYSLIY